MWADPHSVGQQNGVFVLLPTLECGDPIGNNGHRANIVFHISAGITVLTSLCQSVTRSFLNFRVTWYAIRLCLGQTQPAMLMLQVEGTAVSRTSLELPRPLSPTQTRQTFLAWSSCLCRGCLLCRTTHCAILSVTK